METPQPNPTRWKGLGTRVAGALPLVAIVAACVYVGSVLFAGLVVVAAIIMLKEWKALTRNEGQFLQWLGYLLIFAPCASIMWLRFIEVQDEFGPPEGIGMYLVFYLIGIIAATDIGAYFTGKRFGRHKLAPVISPNKTWEGLAGGAACAVTATYFCAPALPLFMCVIIGISACLLAQAGDIFESWVKRRAGVKDSGTLIPGHGGLLDRVDGYLFTAPAFALLVFYYVLV